MRHPPQEAFQYVLQSDQEGGRRTRLVPSFLVNGVPTETIKSLGFESLLGDPEASAHQARETFYKQLEAMTSTGYSLLPLHQRRGGKQSIVCRASDVRQPDTLLLHFPGGTRYKDMWRRHMRKIAAAAAAASPADSHKYSSRRSMSGRDSGRIRAGKETK